MTDEEAPEERELTPEELDRQRGARLPDREAMSLINANVAIPLDAAIAADVLSGEAVSDAETEQDVKSEQSTDPQQPERRNDG